MIEPSDGDQPADTLRVQLEADLRTKADLREGGGPCEFHYSQARGRCPRRAPAGAHVCAWHNPELRHDQPYAGDLLRVMVNQGYHDWDECSLRGLYAPTVNLAGHSLCSADLSDAVLCRADLHGVDLEGAVLRRSDLRGANLRGANLRGADLRGAHLGGADLRQADLHDALVEETVLCGADLRGANLFGARIVSFQWDGQTNFDTPAQMNLPKHRGDGHDSTELFLSPVALNQASGQPHLQRALAESHVNDRHTRTYIAPQAQVAQGSAANGTPIKTAKPIAPAPTTKPGGKSQVAIGKGEAERFTASHAAQRAAAVAPAARRPDSQVHLPNTAPIPMGSPPSAISAKLQPTVEHGGLSRMQQIGLAAGLCVLLGAGILAVNADTVGASTAPVDDPPIVVQKPAAPPPADQTPAPALAEVTLHPIAVTPQPTDVAHHTPRPKETTPPGVDASAITPPAQPPPTVRPEATATGATNAAETAMALDRILTQHSAANPAGQSAEQLLPLDPSSPAVLVLDPGTGSAVNLANRAHLLALGVSTSEGRTRLRISIEHPRDESAGLLDVTLQNAGGTDLLRVHLSPHVNLPASASSDPAFVVSIADVALELAEQPMWARVRYNLRPASDALSAVMP